MFNLKKFFIKEGASNVVSTIEDLTNPVANLTPTQKTELTDHLQTFSVLMLVAILFLTPLLFVPIVANWFDLPKQTFLLIATMLLALAFSLKMVAAKKLVLVRSIFDVPVLLFALSAAVSAYFSFNRFVSLTADPLVFTGGALLFFAITQTVKKETVLLTLIKSLLLSGVVLSLWAVAQITVSVMGVSVPNFLNLGFSPAGSNLSQAMILVAILPLATGLYLKSRQKSVLLLMILNIMGLASTLYSVYKINPAILPFEAGWKIATGTLGQSLKTVFLGVGPSNFVDAFTLYRPATLNTTQLWNIRFSVGGSFYFYILTTIGIIGLSALIFLVFRVAKLAKKRFELHNLPVLEKGLFVSLGSVLAMLAVLPSPTVITVVFFALLGLLVVYFNLSENTSVAHQTTSQLPDNFIVNSLVPLGILAITIFVGYQLGKTLVADYYYTQSLYAASANDGAKTYNLQIQAINMNPNNDIYHMAFAQTNLALADSLASQKDLTDEQKNTVTQLVQQAIREGRNAAALAPQRAANWENLSGIYRSLINFAQGADQWTIASLGQAIALDPNNANLRFQLGGVYFSSKQWQAAAQSFALATNLKPDFANAHYNLAQALKALKLDTDAVKELQLTAQIVCNAGNSDCDRVNKEIEELGASISSSSAQTTAKDTTPLSTPSAGTKNLPKAKTTPTSKIATPSGEIQQ